MQMRHLNENVPRRYITEMIITCDPKADEKRDSLLKKAKRSNASDDWLAL